MNPNAPIPLVTASCSTRDGAVEDVTTVWGTRCDGGFHHTSIAVLTEDRRGGGVTPSRGATSRRSSARTSRGRSPAPSSIRRAGSDTMRSGGRRPWPSSD